MTQPIFVRTRHVYGSYADLWRIVELSDFPTCYVDEVDAASDNTYIVPVRNGEVVGWNEPRARIIFYNLEWDVYPELEGITETWHMDAAFAKRHGYKYVPVGSHPDLCSQPARLTSNEMQFDVAYLMYMTYRRMGVEGKMLERGLRLTPRNNLWGEERDAILRTSRVYIHAHQRDECEAQGIPGLRMAVAAAHRMPVICESIEDRGLFGYTAMMTADYAHLAEFAWHHLKDEHAQFLENYGWALHSLLCQQHTFRNVIEGALQ